MAFVEKCEKILLALGVLLIIFLWPKGLGHDGMFRYHSLRFLLEYGILEDFKFSLVGPLFASPLYFLGKLCMSGEWWVRRFNALLFLGCLYLFHRILKPHISSSMLRRFLLLLIVASMFPKHIKEFYGEPFTTLAIGLGLTLLVLNNTKSGFLLLILGAANTAANLPGLGLAMLVRSLQKRRLYFCLLPLIPFVIVLLENYLRRGHPLLSGYEGESPGPGLYVYLNFTQGPEFSYPLGVGLLAVFLSFGKGLLFYVPALFLPWGFRRHALKPEFRQLRTLWFCILAGLIFMYSRWFSWHGGGFWGPRFFLFACLPACFTLALYLCTPRRNSWQSLLTLLVLALSIWVGWNGLVIDHSLVTEFCNDTEGMIWYVPEVSALWRPFVITPRLNINEWIFSIYFFSVFVCLSAPLWLELKAAAMNCLPKQSL